MKINEYKIKDNVTCELLQKIGFSDYVVDSMYYRKKLCGTVSLNITIPVENKKLKLNGIKILVLDENYLQHYIPFYHANEYQNNAFLQIIILKYNQIMNELVEKGVFENVSFEEEYNNLFDETLTSIAKENQNFQEKCYKVSKKVK